MFGYFRWVLCAAALCLFARWSRIAERPGAPACYFPVLDNQQAWRLLPRADKGEGVPLPAWARAMVRSLPATTAGMLELDYKHRDGSPLEARLAGKMRWMAAHANRCPYSEAVQASTT